MSRSLWSSVWACILVILAAVPAFAQDTSSAAGVVGLRLGNVQTPSPGQATAMLTLENPQGPTRGLSATLKVPTPWEVTEVRRLGSAEALEAFFHQTEETLRVLLVSPQGSVLSAGSGPVLELRLRSRGSADARKLRSALALVEAEVADEQGQPLAVKVINATDTGPTRKAPERMKTSWPAKKKQ